MSNLTEQEFKDYIESMSIVHNVRILFQDDVEHYTMYANWNLNTIRLNIDFHRFFTFDEIHACLCHEIGHIRLEHKCGELMTFEQIREREYAADRYSINVLRCSKIAAITGLIKAYKLASMNLDEAYHCNEFYTHPMLFNRCGALGYTLNKEHMLELVGEHQCHI